jgi:hypothetical protein
MIRTGRESAGKGGSVVVVVVVVLAAVVVRGTSMPILGCVFGAVGGADGGTVVVAGSLDAGGAGDVVAVVTGLSGSSGALSTSIAAAATVASSVCQYSPSAVGTTASVTTATAEVASPPATRVVRRLELR